MSGHSKWAGIKHKKAIVDARRGAALHEARARDHRPRRARAAAIRRRTRRSYNAVQKAKDASMPKDNIERAIAKGTGAGADAEAIETVLYEGYGPGGVALLIEAYTENRNRTGADVRHLLSKHGGNLGEPGQRLLPVREARVVVIVDGARYDEDDLLVAIEAGAQDIAADEDVLEVITAPSDLSAVRAAIEEAGIEIESAEVIQRPSTRVELDEHSALKLFKLIEALEDNDDVGAVHANFEVSEEILEKVIG
jgi:YebC/PmpR family DNA-binding regulatory protein